MLYKENPVIAFITENIEKFGLEKKLIIQISYYANLYNEPIYKIAIIFADEDIYYILQYDYNKWMKIDQCKTYKIDKQSETYKQGHLI